MGLAIASIPASITAWLVVFATGAPGSMIVPSLALLSPYMLSVNLISTPTIRVVSSSVPSLKMCLIKLAPSPSGLSARRVKSYQPALVITSPVSVVSASPLKVFTFFLSSLFAGLISVASRSHSNSSFPS